MRRKLASFAVAALGAVSLSSFPAQAQEAPVVLVTEGIGRVCSSADLATAAERAKWGNLKPGTPAGTKHAWCRYPSTAGYDAPNSNMGQAAWPQWWVPGYQDGSKFQGLFAPGIGPGANGPYSLEILRNTTDPPRNVCVDSLEGDGCGTRLVGYLTPAPINQFGAHAGSSHGEGSFTFSTKSGATTNSGTLGWNNSAATILPLEGAVTAGTGAGSAIIGFSSSRGVTGDATQGNAGVQLPTIGFQVEGIIVQYAA